MEKHSHSRFFTFGKVLVAAVMMASTLSVMLPAAAASANSPIRSAPAAESIEALAGSGLARMQLYSYGAHSAAYDARLKYIRPQYLIDNTAHGFWGERFGYNSASLLQDVSGMKALGIQVIGYTTSSYETQDISFLKRQILNMAHLDGVDGVFIDETTAFPDASKKDYLRQIVQLAGILGIKIWANPGMDSLDPWYFTGAGFDFVQATEQWSAGRPLSPVQQQYGRRISVAGFGSRYYNADSAYEAIMDAYNRGIGFAYANETEYLTLAPWMEQLADRLRI